MRPRFFVLTALLAFFSAWPAAAQPPRLVVIVVVDQMRADYIERFQDDWSSGLKRLVTEGASFTRAAYPYLTTITCAGHATIGTGAYPRTHGIFQNAWYDRDNRAMVACAQDRDAKAIVYGGSGGAAGADSARRLMVPTFADEMREQRGSRVVSLALKARSAIMLAGHGGTAVSWISESLDAWETASTYSLAPVAEVAEYVAANPMGADFGRTWERMLPESRYGEPDAGVGEDAPTRWTTTFPHVLRGLGGPTPDIEFYDQWQRSPFADAYVGRMAGHLARAFSLGQRDTTDVLLVSFSSPDLVGHGFGPDSQEVRDMYARLDRTMGSLLNDLDQLVGAGRYVLALTADHGVTAIPEQLKARGRDAGRISATGISTAVEQAAASALGPGKYVARTYGNDITLEPGVWSRLVQNPQGLRAVLDAVAARPGVERVFRSDEMTAAALTSGDALLRAAALSYVPGASGDIIFAPKSGWMSSAIGTTHGSANADDQRVPVLFFGQGIRPGRYQDPASPADIAPTLAAIAGIKLPKADGHALTPAITTTNTASQSASIPRR